MIWQWLFLLGLTLLGMAVLKRLGVFYGLGLVVLGIGLAWSGLPIRPRLEQSVLFQVLLPPLIFEAACGLDWPTLRRNLAVVGALAGPGVLLGSAAVACAMHGWLSWPWSTAALFGILVSATDPVAVIATFRHAGLGGRAVVLLEAESLFNDGTAAVLFAMTLEWIVQQTGTPVPSSGDALAALRAFPAFLQPGAVLPGVAGATLVGVAAGRAMCLLRRRWTNALFNEILMLGAGYLVFYAASVVHGSGVLAELLAGLMVAADRPALTDELERQAQASLHLPAGLVFVSLAANGMIFLLLGLSLGSQHWLADARLTLPAAGIALLGRACAIYPVSALFRGGGQAIPAAFQHVLVWGGLRGALSLALALSVPAGLPGRDALILATLTVVACSLFAQGPSMPAMLRRLRILRPPE